MFSARWLTVEAISATSSTASCPNASVTPSVFKSSTYWRMRAFCGSLRMRTKSSRVKGSSSTRIGKRPWSSGIRSDGLETWKAPAAMKRMWSVLPMSALSPGDLVELVEEDDAGVLDPADGLAHGLVHVHELLGFLLGQEPSRLAHLEPATASPAGHEIGQHVLDVHADLLHALAGKDLEHGPGLGLDVQLDHALVQLTRPELGAKLVARRVPGGVRRDLLKRAARERLSRPAGQQEVQDPLFGQGLGPLADGRGHLGLDHGDRELGQIANHGLDVPPDVADLGEPGGLDLEEGRLRELGQPPGDLGLSHAGWPDHDDVLRRDLVAELRRQVLAPPAIAERDGHRLLRRLLADDVTVQLRDDLHRRERRGRTQELLTHAHSSVSTVMWSLVYTQMPAAMRSACSAICSAGNSE